MSNISQIYAPLPHLIEPRVKGFIHKTLQDCRKFNANHDGLIFNAYAIGVFILLFGGFLMYMYKGKLTKEEIGIKTQKKHEYIMAKLHQFSHDKSGSLL